METKNERPFIEITDLTHLYSDAENHEVKALDQVTLSVQPGEFVAIIGTNGSGKSTLARHLNALLLPTEGTVKIRDMDTLDESRLWDIRQDVGMVFQNPDNQIVAAIVEEDVAFGPENIGVPPAEIRERVEKALQAVGMTEYRMRAPTCCRAGRSSALPLRGRWRWAPAVLFLTNRQPCSTPRDGKRLSALCGLSTGKRASPSCTLRTIW